MDASSNWHELVAVGHLARPQGRRGEVAVEPLTDFPERFEDLDRVFIEGDQGRVIALRLEWVRQHGGRPILKFDGISGIGEAERLAGREIRIPESELVRLPEGSYFHFRVIGCGVWDHRSGYLGVVEEVLVTGGTDVLVVKNAAREECLIPLCEEICRLIDINKGRIEIEAPEGLVGLNAH
jgi:16S rRNA processing protein RimM